MKKPYVYIYGTGWGSIVAELLTEQGYKVIGMWSYDEEELARICKKLQIPYSTTDIDELFQHLTENQKNKDKSYDAENTIVWVATPPYHLANIARQILEYSNNIVVEAPGVTTVEEAEALLASASKFAIWLCACPYQLKNLPAVRQLRNIIMEKKYGAVKSLEVRIQCNQTELCSKKYNWKYDKDRCGGALNMFGCHIIDLLTYLLNDTKVDSVQGTLKNFVRQNEYINGFRSITGDDVCNFQLRFKSHKNNPYIADDSVVAWVHISMLYPNTVFRQEVTVLTEQACIVLDNCQLKVIPFQTSDDEAPKEIIVETEETPKFTCEGLAPGQPAPYILGMKYFIDSLDIKKLQFPYDEQRQPRLKFLQHLVKVLEKIRLSSEQRERGWVPIEPRETKVTESKSKRVSSLTKGNNANQSLSPS
ncbi:hypothetical protein ACHWQZ_G000062 [Mnemiopsis leidyi]